MVAKMSGFRNVTEQLRDELCYFPFSKNAPRFAVPRKVSLKTMF